MSKIIGVIILLLMISCGKESEKEELQILEGTGTLWLSGGLIYCATQLRMENGDTLIPNQFSTDLMKLKSGNRLKLKYQELNIRESGCMIGKDCKIIKVMLID